MKLTSFLTTISLVLITFVRAQEGDYFVKSSGDTVYCNSKNHIQNNGISTLTMIESGKKVNYSTDEVKQIFHAGKHYVTANVSFGTQASASNLSFVQLIADGKMQLLKIAQNDGNGNDIVVYYARLIENNETVKIDITWKKKLASLGTNCTTFLTAVENSKYKDWSNEEVLISLVNIFSEKCE